MHTKLHKELAELNFSGTVRYSGFVEPLLDKNIYNLLKKARSINKKVNLEMITNGDGWVYNMLLKNTKIINIYKATPVVDLVGNKFDLSKSVKEFFSIMSSSIATYFSPMLA